MKLLGKKLTDHSIEITQDQCLEMEKIAIGAFFPLTGFMNEVEFNSVVNTMRLPTGSPFPLPVVFDISRQTANKIKNFDKVTLVYNGTVVGSFWPVDFFECDRKAVARQLYGTDSEMHPGVSYFYQLKQVFVGGRIELLTRPDFEISNYEITPEQSKSIFAKLKWNKVVGFQTRNVPHRAHEYLLRVALEHADGLLIHPLVGRKKIGDFTPQAVIAGYLALIKNYLPTNRVLLASLSTVMRYAGPREAVFHAIIRRNYGCTHFIVGRDHAGVGDWYGLYDAHDLTRQFDGDLGIEIMRLKGPFFCSKCDCIATESTCPHSDTEFVTHISGTVMRMMLTKGNIPNPHLMRKEVVEALTENSTPQFKGNIFIDN
jgi:sulfate adenylyltransferase